MLYRPNFWRAGGDFVKEKIQMRAGETDKSVSFKDERLFQLICDFVKRSVCGNH